MQFAGLIRYVGEKLRDFFHHYLHTFMIFQLCKTATSVSTIVLHFSREFSLKLSSTYLKMDESTLLTRVCRFQLSKMTTQSQEEEKSYS